MDILNAGAEFVSKEDRNKSVHADQAQQAGPHRWGGLSFPRMPLLGL